MFLARRMVHGVDGVDDADWLKTRERGVGVCLIARPLRWIMDNARERASLFVRLH